MLTLLKTLDSDWIAARQSLTADLTTIETILNRRWGQTFGGTNVLQVPGGGTGISSYTLGDTLYASAATTLSKLAGNITTTRKFLRQVGTGTVSAAPAWDTITNADIPGAAFTKTDDTNVTATLTGTPTTAVLRAMNFALGWTGTLAVTRGGLGVGTLTAHGVLLGQGTSAVTATAVGATNTVLHGNTGADPTYSAVVEADITLANNTTNNATTGRHGFLPILPNDATKFLDGTGAFSTPSSGGPQPYDPGTTVITTNEYMVLAKHLILTGSETMTIQGDGELAIIT